MDCEFETPTSQPEQPQQQQSPPLTPEQATALNRQLFLVLTADIESLRSLYKLYQDNPSPVQAIVLYRRAGEYLDRATHLASSVVLDEEQLAQLQEDKQFLNKLAFELAGVFFEARTHHHRFGHHHRKCGDEETAGEFDARFGFGGHHPFGMHHRGGRFGPFGFGKRGGGFC